MRLAFAGDRDVAVRVLDFLGQNGASPLALLVSGADRASHAEELIARCPGLPPERILRGDAFRSPAGQALLCSLDLDLIVGVHFPYLVPADVLSIPRYGVLNLHPAYLPYNRGWHTPSWTILEGTPAGATLHFMDEGVDTGDIVHRQRMDVSPGDTANSLYRRIKELEFEVFREAWPRLAAGTFRRSPQRDEAGTMHWRSDLLREEVRRLDLDEVVRTGELLRRLRALTTSSPDEAAFYEADGRRYRVQVLIHADPPEEDHDHRGAHGV